MGTATPGHVDQKKLESFTDDLEQRARDAISSRSSWEVEGFSVGSILKDEIALMLHQLSGSRVRGKKIEQSLLQEESEINTELMQMEQRTPRYSPYRFPEREKLQRRRGRLSEERRRFRMTQAEKLDGLHERLLGLIGKERILRMR